MKERIMRGAIALGFSAVIALAGGSVALAGNEHKTVGPAGYNTPGGEQLIIAGSQPTPTVGPGDHVVICHALGNGGFNQIAPSAGDVFGHAGSQHQDGKDIIPPFKYMDNQESENDSLAAGQNWTTTNIAIYNNGCVVPGQGGGMQDCDGDYDNSAQSECQAPQKDCDGDYDSSTQAECNPVTPPTTPPTGGMGGGLTTTATTTVATSAPTSTNTPTTGGRGAGEAATVPAGAVNAGEGGASGVVNIASLVGLISSLGAGSLYLRRTNSKAFGL